MHIYHFFDSTFAACVSFMMMKTKNSTIVKAADYAEWVAESSISTVILVNCVSREIWRIVIRLVLA